MYIVEHPFIVDQWSGTMFRKTWQFLMHLIKEGPYFRVQAAAAIVLATLFASYKWLPPLAQHLALTLAAILLMHLFDYYLLASQLVRNIHDTVEGCLRSGNTLLLNASDNGITHIYSNRSDAWRDALALINSAESEPTQENRKIWAVGISLSEECVLTDLLEAVHQRRVAAENVYISLLDAVSGAGVFRDCLENKLSSVSVMVLTDNSDYIDHNIWQKFQEARRSFREGYPDYQTSVRFYNHTPLCWMIIVGDVAFYQPYTFGGVHRDEDHWNIGSEMPIFRIENRRSKTFAVLQDHAEKLWYSSDVTYSQIDARHRAQAQEDLVHSIFQARGDFFKWIVRP